MISMTRITIAPVFALILLFATTTPGIADEPANGLKVVASIFPLHALTAGVMEGIGEPGLLLDPTVSPHHFSLKPSQARLLQEADLIIWVGPTLEYPLNNSIANLPAERSLTLVTDADENGHEDEHFNAHLWLDPIAAKDIVSVIGGRLRALDPAHAALYDQNVNRLVARLDALEAELVEQLRPIARSPYIVYHDAYGPFERRFDLNNVGIVTKHAEDAPSAGRIRHIRAVISEQKVRCVFREPQFEPNAIKIIAENSDIKIGELDPLGVGLTPGVNGYFSLMHKLGESFATCLGRT